MDPSTFLGSVWGIIYYNLEAFLYLLRQCLAFGSIGIINHSATFCTPNLGNHMGVSENVIYHDISPKWLVY